MDDSERSEESDSGCMAPSPSGSASSPLYRVPVAAGDHRPGFEQGRQGAQPRPEPGVCEVAANEAAEDAPEEAAVAEDGGGGGGGGWEGPRRGGGRRGRRRLPRGGLPPGRWRRRAFASAGGGRAGRGAALR